MPASTRVWQPWPALRSKRAPDCGKKTRRGWDGMESGLRSRSEIPVFYSRSGRRPADRQGREKIVAAVETKSNKALISTLREREREIL